MNIIVDGQTVKIKKIGKGTFSSIYFGDDNMVYAMVSTNSHEIDYSKEAVAQFADHDNKHVPQIEVIENEYYFGKLGYVNIYRMPKYNKLSGENLQTVNKIIAAYKKVINECYRCKAYELSNKIIEAINSLQIADTLKDAIQEIYDASCNYSDSYMIEFAKRNIMQDDNGNIILLDIIFNQKALAELKRNRHNFW